MADDIRLNMKLRKAITSCWFDISRMRTRVTRGRIYVQGNVKRTGEDPEDPDCNLPFLEKMDSLVRDLPGVKGVRYTFDNWKQNKAGSWLFTGKRPKPKKKNHPVAPGSGNAATASNAADSNEPEEAVADEVPEETGHMDEPDETPVPL